MTMKEIAKKIIASINPGKSDISGIGDGTITGAISELNKNITDIKSLLLIKSITITSDGNGWFDVSSEVLEGYRILALQPYTTGRTVILGGSYNGYIWSTTLSSIEKNYTLQAMLLLVKI